MWFVFILQVAVYKTICEILDLAVLDGCRVDCQALNDDSGR